MTIYSQSANTNATNSELDAKQIITHKQLTSDQQNDIIEQYVELIVDNMDTKDLVRYAQEQLTDYFTKLSQHELKEDIDCYNEDLYYELVDNITIEDEDAKLQHFEEIKYDREVN